MIFQNVLRIIRVESLLTLATSKIKKSLNACTLIRLMLLFIRVKAVRGQDDEKVNIVRVASIF